MSNRTGEGPGSAPAHTRVLDLLRQHGWNATSFQVLEPGFEYWFDADACVAYVDTGRAWVAAGAPIEAIEENERIAVPRELVRRRGESFVLRVRGDSMIEEQIRDGDFVVVESRPEARDGETVVALIRGEDATLKRFYRRGPRVRLEPANAAMRPIEVSAAEVEIRGVVRGLLRRY